MRIYFSQNIKNILFTKELQNIVWQELTLKEGILAYKTSNLKAKNKISIHFWTTY